MIQHDNHQQSCVFFAWLPIAIHFSGARTMMVAPFVDHRMDQKAPQAGLTAEF